MHLGLKITRCTFLQQVDELTTFPPFVFFRHLEPPTRNSPIGRPSVNRPAVLLRWSRNTDGQWSWGRSERSKLVESMKKTHEKSGETPSIFRKHMEFSPFLLMLGAFCLPAFEQKLFWWWQVDVMEIVVIFVDNHSLVFQNAS